MKDKLFHAHYGGAEACIAVPETLYDVILDYGWACPYGTKQAAKNAAPFYPQLAIAFVYNLLNNLTVKEFEHGGDRPARIALDAIYRWYTSDASNLMGG